MGKVQQQAKADVWTPERHDRARDFVRFVAENDADLRRAVRKNVTYDEEVLENAYVNRIKAVIAHQSYYGLKSRHKFSVNIAVYL